MLYPNKTTIIQPLVAGYFTPLNAAWVKERKRWQSAHPEDRFNPKDFTPTLKKAIASIDCKKSLKDAFRHCGLFPFKTQESDAEKIVAGPSTVVLPLIESCFKDHEKACPILEAMKKFIPEEVVQQFKECQLGIWYGGPRYRALFSAWQNFKHELESVCNIKESMNGSEYQTKQNEESLLLKEREEKKLKRNLDVKDKKTTKKVRKI